MKARIFKPAKTAMQSGRGTTKQWVLDYEPQAPKGRDPLMGWTMSRDTTQQLRLHFDTKEEAIAFCERHGLDFVVREPRERRVKPKSYAANFRWDLPG